MDTVEFEKEKRMHINARRRERVALGISCDQKTEAKKKSVKRATDWNRAHPAEIKVRNAIRYRVRADKKILLTWLTDNWNL